MIMENYNKLKHISCTRREFLNRLADRDVVNWQKKYPGVIYTKPMEAPKWLRL